MKTIGNSIWIIKLTLSSFFVLSGLTLVENTHAKDNDFLCLKKAGIIECLDRRKAKKKEVRERLEIFNKGKSEDETYRCKKEKYLGSKFPLWRCSRNGQSKEDEIGKTNMQRQFNRGDL